MTKNIPTESKELALARKQLEIIRNVSVELNNFTGLQTKLNNILSILDQQFGLTHSMILLPDKNQNTLTVYASKGYPEIKMVIPMGKGMAGMAAQKRIPINLTGLNRKKLYVDATLEHRGKDEVNLPGLANANSQIAIPLLANNELVAVLTTESTAPSVFSVEDEQFLLTLTTHIAISIQNSILYDSMEEKIKLRTIELEQSNQTKDKLFSIISHDLRSPVASFQSITQLLKHYISRGESHKIEGLNEKIDQSVHNLNFLLDNLLNWSLSQGDNISCHYETILFEPFIREITAIYNENFIAKEISLSLSVTQDIEVLADPDTLSVVFRNLISNALKFTPRKGEISISSAREKDFINITLADNGVGMDEEKVNSLFTSGNKKSSIGTEKERGTGLGLILVHEFILLNKGTITIESTPEKGTRFLITLPAKVI